MSNYVQTLQDAVSKLKSEDYQVKIYPGGKFMPSKQFAPIPKHPHIPSYIMNLQTFESMDQSIRKVKSLKDGWAALISDQTVTFLHPNMISYFSHEISSVHAISEYSTNKLNLIAVISPRSIAVFQKL